MVALAWGIVATLLVLVTLLVQELLRQRSRVSSLLAERTRLSQERLEYGVRAGQYAAALINERNEWLVRETILARRCLSAVVDDKTQSLIRLATSNPDRNESASAALIACKLLKRALDA